jgi:hypothetical protein
MVVEQLDKGLDGLKWVLYQRGKELARLKYHLWLAFTKSCLIPDGFLRFFLNAFKDTPQYPPVVTLASNDCHLC